MFTTGAISRWRKKLKKSPRERESTAVLKESISNPQPILPYYGTTSSRTTGYIPVPIEKVKLKNEMFRPISIVAEKFAEGLRVAARDFRYVVKEGGELGGAGMSKDSSSRWSLGVDMEFVEYTKVVKDFLADIENLDIVEPGESVKRQSTVFTRR